MQAIKSVNGTPIRLTNERWFHIVENHDDIAGMAFDVLERNYMVQKEILNNAIEIMPYIMKMPSKHIWLDYDKEADVMYVSFEKPQQATDTEVLDNGMLIRKRNNKIVGLTLMHASQI